MIVDYKSRKNEVLASYNTVEVLLSELQNYAKQIGLPDPSERLSNLLSDIYASRSRTTICLIWETKYQIQKSFPMIRS